MMVEKYAPKVTLSRTSEQDLAAETSQRSAVIHLQHTRLDLLMVGGERTTCASTASSLNLRRANARRPLTHLTCSQLCGVAWADTCANFALAERWGAHTGPPKPFHAAGGWSTLPCIPVGGIRFSCCSNM
jgi:hypothetical protein